LRAELLIGLGSFANANIMVEIGKTTLGISSFKQFATLPNTRGVPQSPESENATDFVKADAKVNRYRFKTEYTQPLIN